MPDLELFHSYKDNSPALAPFCVTLLNALVRAGNVA